MSTQKRFFSGMLILAFSNVLIKAAGLLFKIPLTNLIKDTGMASFNAAYTIYAWFYTLTTAGLSVAVSMLVSESRAKGNAKQVRVVLRTTLLLFFIVGLAGTLIMVFGARAFSKLIEVPESAVCIAAIAPSLFFSCLSSAFRGYFQGYQIMFPTAVSQVLEALGKLFIGISIAAYTKSLGYEIHEVAASALLGISIGVAAGFLFLVGTKFFFNETKYNAEYDLIDGEEPKVSRSSEIAKRILVLAVPIAISSSVMSLTNIFDTLLMTSGLIDFGYTNEFAKKIYGNYTSLAVPMFNLPPVFIYAIGYSVVPLVNAALARREEKAAKRYMLSSIKLTSLIAMPCAIGLGALSYQILSMFFDIELVKTGAPLLTALSPSVYFVCLLAITNSILQVCNKERLPIISMLAGGAVKLLSSYILIPIIGEYGTPVGTLFCYITIVGINMYFVIKHARIVPSVKEIFAKPLFSGAFCGAAAVSVSYFGSMYLPEKLATVLAIGAAVAVYFICVLIFGCITEDDVEMLPKKAVGIMRKLKIIKQVGAKK